MSADDRQLAGLSAAQLLAVTNAVASGAIEGWQAGADDLVRLAEVVRGAAGVDSILATLGGATAAADRSNQANSSAVSRWRWADYIYPDTAVLVNLLGIRDVAGLKSAEGLLVSARAVEISIGATGFDTSSTPDDTFLRNAHQWLAQDLYPWAGSYRNVPIGKGRTSFAPVQAIADCVAKAVDVVANTEWPALDDQEFSQRSAQVFAWLNYAHPFRDLNGRVTRVFLDAVAGLAGRVLDYRAVDPEVWLQRSAFTTPDEDQDQPQHQWMVPVLAAICRGHATDF
jgi:cell filamentation protein